MRFAQNVLQLYNSMQRAGYRDEQLALIRRAYSLATALVSGGFQPSGKEFLAHGIGTASILQSLGASAETVAAGMLHNIYEKGDFGVPGRGPTREARAEVDRLLGSAVEARLTRFWEIRSSRAEFESAVTTCKSLDRDVLLIHVGEHLEQSLELEPLFRGDCEDRLRHVRGQLEQLVDIAIRLDQLELAQHLEASWTAITSNVDAVPENLRSHPRYTVILPRSVQHGGEAEDLCCVPGRIGPDAAHHPIRPERFAQTNIELYAQLRASGWSTAELMRAHLGYELAVQVFTCLYRPSGKTHLSHCIGTASILAFVDAPVELVLTGLLHSIYRLGDFGSDEAVDPATIRGCLGAEIEARLCAYRDLDWANTELATHRKGRLSPVDRDVLLVRLADTIEDHLDLGILYAGDAAPRQGACEKMLPDLMGLAGDLGVPELAFELERALKRAASASISAELEDATGPSRVFRVLPRSYGDRSSRSAV
jgi:(p)ppGpp synthase/HD superfamily hydrolase